MTPRRDWKPGNRPGRPDVRYGAGAIGTVPELIASLSARRVLLVCGQQSFEASGAARILPALRRAATVRRWSEFTPNPDAADLAAGLRLAAGFQPQLVLGIGGGTALDLAKLLSGYAPLTDQAALSDRIRSGEPVTRREPALVLAPTTSGSGSEATHFAVVYLDGEKFSVAGPALRPDTAILDPALTVSGSRYQRASSGIDAVAQAIESMWAVAATDRSRRWARHALALLLPHIASYVDDPAGGGAAASGGPAGVSPAARAMAIGSHLAGRAIDISKTTAAHALSYGLTQRFGISHGHAVAITLGAFIETHAAAVPGQLRVDPAAHQQAMAEVLARLGATDGAAGRAQFGALLDRLGLPASPPQLREAPPAQRQALAAAVNAQRLGNNPVALDQRALAGIIDASAGAGGLPR